MRIYFTLFVEIMQEDFLIFMGFSWMGAVIGMRQKISPTTSPGRGFISLLKVQLT